MVELIKRGVCMKIFKTVLDLEDTQRIDLPMGATLLTVQTQNGKLCLWYECYEKALMQKRVIAIFGTGHPMPDNPGKYIGTVQLSDGGLVFHVYDLYGER